MKTSPEAAEKRDRILNLFRLREKGLVEIRPPLVDKLDGAIEALHWCIGESTSEGWIDEI